MVSQLVTIINISNFIASKKLKVSEAPWAFLLFTGYKLIARLLTRLFGVGLKTKNLQKEKVLNFLEPSKGCGV